MSYRYLYCGLLKKLIPGIDECCSSCHGEFEDWYAECLDVALPDGYVAMTCCSKANWIHDHPAEVARAFADPRKVEMTLDTHDDMV